MEVRAVNQFGAKSLYIEKNNGTIYVSNNYTEDPSSAFYNGSYELLGCTPTIEPEIPRMEVSLIQEWIEQEALSERTSRLALLYGKAGIGKSIVMRNLLERLQAKEDYLVFGLKSDQVEFVDTDDLSHRIHLEQPIEVVIRNSAQRYKRVVLLIDQIDALSLSLSSNRTPLRSLLKLIERIQSIENVRVVISCRPYDLEYDPLLDNLKIKNKWELKELTSEQVSHVLENNHYNLRLSDKLLRFLSNPLHLYLFLKVKADEQLTEPLSVDLLYHQLWRMYINDDSIRNVDKNRLLSLLDFLVSTMYGKQELSVHIREYETQYNPELQYLLTNGILTITRNCQTQFFHQTLFDYIYARRFIENGYNLLAVLKNQHQGLFSRAAVKSILTFLREHNPADYIRIVEQLLYAKDDKNRDVYRFHLKSLALGNMAYFDSPLPAEINFISRRIYSDKVYMDVIFESIYTTNWFNAIWGIIDSKGGWQNIGQEYKEKIMVMCQRTLWFDANTVLEKLDAVLDCDNEEDCKYLKNILQLLGSSCDGDKIVSLYRKISQNKHSLEYTHLLSNILTVNPVFVFNELKSIIKLQLEDNKKNYVGRIELSHGIGNIYRELLEHHHELGVQLLVDNLNIVYESTMYDTEAAEICSSTEFWGFKRTTGGFFTSNFVEDATNILIDDLSANINNEKSRSYISEFCASKHGGLVFIALYIYTLKPEIFKDDIYAIIINRQVLANAPCWVEYQAVEALKVSFPLMNDAQKSSIIDRILTIDDKSEYKQFGENQKNRWLYGPILDIDLHKGKALEVLPLEDLRKISWIAYQERQRIDRKFSALRLKNDKPCSSSAHMGWSSLTREQGFKMSPKAWYKSMLTYNKNPFGWDKPSLTGQCHLFRTMVGQSPDKYIDLIKQIVHDNKVQLAYAEAGLQGLIDAQRIDDAMTVLKDILGSIDNDVNSDYRGFSIHSLLFAIDDILKQAHIPEIVVKLLCNTLLNAVEDVDSTPSTKDIYNVGINQARGHAGHLLVQCAHEGCYKDVIFQVLESVADTASVYTRAAILVRMAYLNHLDKDRNVQLFKKLMHDYDPRLMAMPVHNYNPIVYFINYALEDMMEFFHHATECPECYGEQVKVLWLAWTHNNKDERIKALLDKMCNASLDARVSLINFFRDLDGINDDAIRYVIYFMSPQFDSPKMGETIDNLFYRIDKWPDYIQYKVADTYVNSPLCKHKITRFIGFLGGYAIKDPVQSLRWLEQVLAIDVKDDYFIWNQIMDVIIQSYNGIKSFNDDSYRSTLENAMDMIDTIMQNPSNKYLISNFINKLDNE